MTLLSQREAAKCWGIGRNRLIKAIKDGEISLSANKKIDVSEMARVFGPGPVNQTVERVGDPVQETEVMLELISLRERVDRLQAELSRADLVIETQKQTIGALQLLTHQPQTIKAKRKSFWSRLLK